MQDGEQLTSKSTTSEPEILESAVVPAEVTKGKSSLMWASIIAVMAVLLTLVGLAIYALRDRNGSSKQSATSINTQKVDTSSLAPAASSFNVVNDTVVINGQLQAAQNIVIIPTGEPEDAVIGQIYLNEEDTNLYYYNGQDFVSISGAVTNTTTNVTNVTNVTNNTGTSLPQPLGTTDSPTFANLNLSGDLSMGSSSTVLTNNLQQTAVGNDVTINAGNDQITFYANGLSFVFPSTGGSGQTICTTGVSCAAGGGQAVILAPNNSGTPAAQENASPTIPSIFIDNTGGANILQLQNNGTDSFVVSQSGAVTGTGGYTFNGATTDITTGTNQDLTVVANGTGQIVLNDTIQIPTLGSADSNTVVCRNSSNQLSSCTDSFATTSNAYLQGGNAFGATGTLGLTDANTLNIITNNTARISINSAGNTTVTGGTSGVALTINNSTSTGNILSAQDNGTNVFTVADGGAVLFKNTVNSVNALTVQNAASGEVLNIDTTNTILRINGANNPELQVWTANATTLPAGRYSHGLIAQNGYLYAISGDIGTPSTEIRSAKVNANGSVGSWNTTTEPTAYARYGATTVGNGHIYMLGGQASAGGAPTTNIYFGKIAQGGTVSSWQESISKLDSYSTSSSLGVAGASSVYTNGYLYLLGGSTALTGTPAVPQAGVAQTKVQYAKVNADGSLGGFTADTDSPLPAARVGGSVVVANGYMYYVGGLNTSSTAQSTVYYAPINSDGSLGSWTATSSLSAAKSYHGATVMNGYLYVYGGGTSATSGSTTVQYAALNSDGTVGTFSAATNSLAATTASFGYAALNGYIYTVGGYNSGAPITTVQYTSGPRTNIAGSLDLVGLSGETLTDGGSGGTLTAGNTRIVGTLEVADEAVFADAVSVFGNLQAGGQLTVKNSVDSQSAFQVQNAGGQTLFAINTADTLINPGYTAGSESVDRTFNNVISGQFDIGQGLSIALGSDGKPVILALSSETGPVERPIVYKCYVNDCSTGAKETIIPGYTDLVVGNASTDLIVGSDGLPLMVFKNAAPSPSRLEIMWCGTHDCSSDKKINTVTDNLGTGGFPSIALSAEKDSNNYRRPIIAHQTQGGDIWVTRCINRDCSGSPEATYRPTVEINYSQSIGGYTNISIGADNLPIIATRNTSTNPNSVDVLHCEDTTCANYTRANILHPSLSQDIGNWTAMEIVNGLPLIVTQNSTYAGNAIFIIRCLNIRCNGGVGVGYTHTEIYPGNVGDSGLGLMVGSDGLPLITFKDNLSTDGLGIIHCGNLSCTDNNKSTKLNITVTTNDGQYSQPIQAFDGLPIVLTGSNDGSPGDGINNNWLAIARCADVTCTATNRLVPSGGIDLGTTLLPFAGLYVETINDSLTSAGLRFTSTGDFYANSLSSDSSGNVAVSSDSETSLQVKQADSGLVALNVDSSGYNANLVTNGEFESTTRGWQALVAGTTISQDINERNIGEGSLAATVTTTTGQGAYYPVRLIPSTLYAIRFAAKSSVTWTGLAFGYSADGSSLTDCQSSQTVSATGWRDYECILQTPASITGSPFLYIRRTDTTAGTLYIDSVSLFRDGSANTVTNSGFEVDTSGWALKAGSSIARDTVTFYAGAASLQLITSTASNAGVRFPVVLSPTTTYVAQFRARLSSSSLTTFGFGYSYDGTTTNEQDCKTDQTINTTWVLFTCAFTTPQTMSGSPYFYMERTGTTSTTIYFDEVYLAPGGNQRIIQNGNFESSSNGWAATAGATIAQTDSQSYLNEKSLRVNILGVISGANHGAHYIVSLSPSTTYTAQFHAKLDSGTFTTMDFGYSSDGSTNTDCSTGQSVTTSGWTLFSCTFTTPSTIDTSTPAPYFYLENTAGTDVGLYIDAVQIKLGSAAGSYGDNRFQLNGAINSPMSIQATTDSTSIFRIMNSTGSTIFVADSLNNRVGVGTSNPAATFHVSSSGTDSLFRITDATSTAVNVLDIADEGAVTFRNRTNSSAGFRIQNAAGTIDILNVNTSSLRVEIASGSDLHFAGAGNTRNAITKDFTCTASEAVNEIVIVTGAATVGETTTAASNRVAGVVVAKPVATTCTVAFSGMVQVNFGGNADPANIGDPVETSTEAGAAQSTATPTAGAVLGVSMSNQSADLVWVLLRGN